MKILHLLYESQGDYFGIGGVGARAYEIYGRLKDRHEITLLCRKYPGAEDKDIDGLRHIFVGTESKSFTKALLSYAYHAAGFVRKYGDDFDIIIEEFSPAIPTFLHLFTTKPIVLQIQGYTGAKYFEKYNIFYSGILFIFEQVRPLFYNNFIVVSDITRKRYHLDNSNKNIELIKNGVTEGLLSHDSQNERYILFLGRIDIHHKGLDVLITAYREFHKTFPDIRLVIAGDGRDREHFKTMLMKLPDDVRRNIELSGWISGDKKTEVISKALFAVFPSRYEVQPIAILEELACGKAIVVSDIPELSYITENGVGVSFKSGDAGSLADAMKALTVRKDIHEMGRKGRDLVKDLTWDKIALRFEEFLEKAKETYLTTEGTEKIDRQK